MIPILLPAGLEAYTPDPTKRIVPVKRVHVRQPRLAQTKKGLFVSGKSKSPQLAYRSRQIDCYPTTFGMSNFITTQYIMPENYVHFNVGDTLGILWRGFNVLTASYIGLYNYGTEEGVLFLYEWISDSTWYLRVIGALTWGASEALHITTNSDTPFTVYAKIKRVSATSAQIKLYSKTEYVETVTSLAGDPVVALNNFYVGARTTLAYFENFDRSDNEIKSLLSNPWQIFEPETVLLPIGITVDPENPPQLLAPISDITQGVWTPSSGSDLYAMIDEAVSDEIDFIVTSSPSLCEMRIAVGADPLIGTGHILRYTIEAPGTLNVRLVQGTTVIASWTHSAVGMTTFEQTLTTEQADSITNYSDLRLQFETV